MPPIAPRSARSAHFSTPKPRTPAGPRRKTHVGRLLTKLNARDRVHLVIYAYEHRLLNPKGRPHAG